MSNIYTTGNDVVDEVGTMNFSGNIVCSNWYNTILKDNGAADSIAIHLLADIVYWYRPSETRDETTGQTIAYHKRFKADCLQRSYLQIMSRLGISKCQAKSAVKRLEDLGLICREFRTVDTTTARLNNVMFIHLNPDALRRITYPDAPMKKLAYRGAADNAQGCSKNAIGSGEKGADIYRDNVTKDYSESNQQPTNPPLSRDPLIVEGAPGVWVVEEDGVYSDSFEEAWEDSPTCKRSKRCREHSWQRWQNVCERNDLDEESLKRFFQRYVEEQRNAGVEKKYIAALSTWLDPSIDINGFSLTVALKKQAKMKEAKAKQYKAQMAARDEEERRREAIEREEEWRERDPVAMELFKAAFKVKHGLDFAGRATAMQKYFDYKEANLPE